MITHSVFKPAWWLPEAHTQTIWPVLSQRRIFLNLIGQRITLDDGDFVDLSWVKSDCAYARRPIVLILHGLTGSIRSQPIRGLLAAFNQLGWQAGLMYFRGCHKVFNRQLQGYHAGETQDLADVLHAIRRCAPDSPLMVVGISLGGNVLLKWLGETKRNNPLCAAVAISVPFDLGRAASRLQQGFSRFYQWRLLKMLRRDFIAKFRRLSPGNIEAQMRKLHNFWQFDEQITAPLYGFQNVWDYYAKCSSRQFIPDIQVPTLIIQALDDPFLSQDAIPQARELSADVQLELSLRGGHVGFIQGSIPGRGNYWLEKRIPEFLQAIIAK